MDDWEYRLEMVIERLTPALPSTYNGSSNDSGTAFWNLKINLKNDNQLTLII